MNAAVHTPGARLEALRPAAQRFLQAIEAELERLGFSLAVPRWETSHVSLQTDSEYGTAAAFGCWEAHGGGRMASWLVCEDGRAYADLDVMALSPQTPLMFVESITAICAGEEGATSGIIVKMNCHPIQAARLAQLGA